MDRVELLPEWPGSVYEKWSFNFSKKNAWRIFNVAGDFEDAMSECLACYYECRLRYGPTTRTQKHFMYMFKLMVNCWFHTLSVKDKKIREGNKQVSEIVQKTSIVTSDAGLAALLTSASDDLKTILNVFLNGPTEVIETLRIEIPDATQKQFFKGVMKICGIPESKANTLSCELRELLS